MKKYITLAIMMSLLSGKRFNAPELADKYETSVKTIYRAIDTLLSAGMPIRCIAGKGGGYELIKESEINTSFFTMKELCSFVSFIQSTKDTYSTSENSIIERLNQIKDKNLANDILSESQQIVFDINTWGSSFSNIHIDNIKKSISECSKLIINYATNDSEESRIIHPYTLVYKMGSWYLYAFCEKRQSFRLFKLSKIIRLTNLNQNFIKQNIDTSSTPWNKDFKENLEVINIQLLAPKSLLSDIKEWLSSNIQITEINAENKQLCLINSQAIYSIGLIHRLMQYSDKIKVLSPKKLQESLIKECKLIFNNYNS